MDIGADKRPEEHLGICFSSKEDSTDNCEEMELSEYPECSDEDELVILNRFGQPVCHCPNDTYRLEDPFSNRNITGKKKCFHPGDITPCPSRTEALDFFGNENGLLKCGVSIVQLTIFHGSNKCTGGKVFAFGRCQSARRSG
jgi:hypothetical protein